MANDPLVVGHRYVLTIKPSDSPNAKHRILVGKYLGWNKFYTAHDFDLRPDHGTTTVKGEDIISCEELTTP